MSVDKHEFTTVGEFLKEKACNMSKWLQNAGHTNDYDLGTLHSLQVVAFAQNLALLHGENIKTRNFEGLLNDKDTPEELKPTIAFVQEDATLHDKFWRYLALFSETVSVKDE
mgnify:CR=1 FL=1|tara:strand:- start:424 stop:759 length:336 start_codon:yes stop_codon:yes gene_type:complete